MITVILFFSSLLQLSALGIGDLKVRGVTYAEFSPDDTCIVFSSGDGAIRIWDIGNEQIVRQFPAHYNGVYTATYSPNGKYILSTGADGFLRVWDSATGLAVFTIHAFDGLQLPGVTPTFNAAGDRIVSISALTGTIQMLNAHNGKKLWDRQIKTFLYSAAFSPDGDYIAIGDGDYVIHILDSKSGNIIRTFEKAHSDPVASISFSGDGKYMLSAADLSICLWDFESGKLIYKIKADGFASFVRFSPDGTSFISVASDDVYIRSASTGKQITKITEETYYSSDVRSAVFSHDGNYIVTVREHGDVNIWNVQTGNYDDSISHYFDYTEYEFTEEDIERLYSEFDDLYEGYQNFSKLKFLEVPIT
jgi:WD40 repeat protein